jgi:DNA-binding NarL/FixJ family response regulator
MKADYIRRRITLIWGNPNQLYCELIAKEFRYRKCRIDVIKSAVDSSSLLGLFASVRADVVVTNARLRDGPRAGYRVIQQLRKTSPKTHIVVTLDSVDRQQVIDAFRNGAHGVVSGDDSFEVLCKCIEAVARGEIWASRRELYYVLDALSTVPPSRLTTEGESNALTKREEDVVRLVAEARTNREISQQLMLSPNTVRNYLFRIFDKTGVSNRMELVLRTLHREEDE